MNFKLYRGPIHEAITGKLGFHKLCAQWVPKHLIEQHKMNGLAAVEEFSQRFRDEGDNFLESIVTGEMKLGLPITLQK